MVKTATRIFPVFLWAIAPLALPAQTFKQLDYFDGTNGAFPEASLVQGIDGNLYGTTYFGTIFKVNSDGELKTIAKVPGMLNTPLIQADDGYLYGQTATTIFKISTAGELTSVYTFYRDIDGYAPFPLVQDVSGVFYGTTDGGGVPCFEDDPCGTAFSLTPNAVFTSLLSFTFTEGDPGGPLVLGPDTNFYGTTWGGDGTPGGIVFRLTPAGALTTLYTCNSASGRDPSALVLGSDGYLYATAFEGGAYELGTVFKISPSGALTTLYNFDGSHGSYPRTPLIQATDGNFYGSTPLPAGGDNGGTIFRITPSGELTTLYTFPWNDLNTGGPNALYQATNGNLYGTTYGGGTADSGTVFELALGLPPFVTAVPHVGPVNRSVRILGTNLVAASAVTFNGTPAPFTVVSRSEIITTVPEGASSGTIQVSTPSAVLLSNVPFQVTQ